MLKALCWTLSWELSIKRAREKKAGWGRGFSLGLIRRAVEAAAVDTNVMAILRLPMFADADDVKAAAYARELGDKMGETEEFRLKVVRWAFSWELPTKEPCEIFAAVWLDSQYNN